MMRTVNEEWILIQPRTFTLRFQIKFIQLSLTLSLSLSLVLLMYLFVVIPCSIYRKHVHCVARQRTCMKKKIVMRKKGGVRDILNKKLIVHKSVHLH
jgi:hypothetical protein